MDLVTGALPSVLSKLGELLLAEYNLHKDAKEGIRFLQKELQSINGALEHISHVPVDERTEGDKVWTRDIREMSYDIEDSIDVFMEGCKSMKHAEQHGFFTMARHKLMEFKKRHNFGKEVREIKNHVHEVYERHQRYKVETDVAKPVKIDPRLLAMHRAEREIVGIDKARDEVIQLLGEGHDKASEHQSKIVSIAGFGGLGKTTLAKAVYHEIRPLFDCSAFITVSQTPDTEKLLKNIMEQLDNKIKISIHADIYGIINQLKAFLRNKRYFIVIDDIWDIQHWKQISCALPDDDSGCKIIMTTRNWKVAQDIGVAYYMRPLSPHNSKILLYRRIFGKEDEDVCADVEVNEVLDKILKKCDGVPLAIITIGSLLASKERNKWNEVCNFIGTGMEKNCDMENMRNILLLSYYDLPSHLKTCLLYFSFFPEDYAVDKYRLIWMWIAEGFIKCEKQGIRLDKVGKNYLMELINRSMIQPVYNGYGKLVWCRVHDIVLEVIRSLASEENFMVVNGVDHKSPIEKVRRLSLQNDKINHSEMKPTEQVRSVVVFGSAINVMPPIKKFRVLRVLDLENCDLSQGCLEYLGKLHHLRYLGLQSTRGITQTPKEIGRLQLLQTLDISNSSIFDLSMIPRLGNLIRLMVDFNTCLPMGIRRLKCLQVLPRLRIDYDTEVLEELGYLRELRLLHVDFCAPLNETLAQCLVESLQKLEKLQELTIEYDRGYDLIVDGWVVGPSSLRSLEVKDDDLWLSTLPTWIDPLKLVELRRLFIQVRRLEAEELELLGRLPALRKLRLTVDQFSGGFIAGAGFFSCLLEFTFCARGDAGHVAFHPGAMPLLEELFVAFNVTRIKDLGLENLPSLQMIEVGLLSGGASKEEVEVAKAALKHAAKIHPNRPELDIYTVSDDEDEEDGTSSDEDNGSDED